MITDSESFEIVSKTYTAELMMLYLFVCALKGEEVPEHASTLAFEVDEEPDAKPQLSLSYHL